jgi:hypothetical protein
MTFRVRAIEVTPQYRRPVRIKTRNRLFRAYVSSGQLRTCLPLSLPPLCANTGREQMQQCASLFYHLVGASEHRRGDL